MGSEWAIRECGNPGSGPSGRNTEIFEIDIFGTVVKGYSTIVRELLVEAADDLPGIAHEDDSASSIFWVSLCFSMPLSATL